MNIILSLIIAFLNTSNFIFNHAFDTKVKTPEYVVKYCNAINDHTFIDDSGNLVSPTEPNGYKFELLVLDMIHMMDNNLAFEVEREKEFAPIKNLHGSDSVDSGRELLIKNGVNL